MDTVSGLLPLLIFLVGLSLSSTFKYFKFQEGQSRMESAGSTKYSKIWHLILKWISFTVALISVPSMWKYTMRSCTWNRTGGKREEYEVRKRLS